MKFKKNKVSETVKIGAYVFSQERISNHISGFKDGRLVCHAHVHESLTRSELEDHARQAIEFMQETEYGS